jgi:hypothetical protein
MFGGWLSVALLVLSTLASPGDYWLERLLSTYFGISCGIGPRLAGRCRKEIRHIGIKIETLLLKFRGRCGRLGEPQNLGGQNFGYWLPFSVSGNEPETTVLPNSYLILVIYDFFDLHDLNCLKKRIE